MAEPFELEFYGATREVTGSCHILRVGGLQILLECGLVQGGRQRHERNREDFPFDASAIDAVVLSHAHIDHSGRLPLLVQRGFGGPIYVQQGTAQLCDIMLRDSAGLAISDAERENRKRARKDLPAVTPLYTLDDVERTLRQFAPLPYRERREILPGVSIRFVDAGHILGSASVEVWLKSGSVERKLLFSGDLGQYDTPIIKDPAKNTTADLVLMESTYGNRQHRGREATVTELATIISEADHRKGNILIPAFAVGRTQEILYLLATHYEEWGLERWQVFLDSPMAIKTSQVYWDNPELHDKCGMPALPNLVLSESAEESQRINRMQSGAIVIAGSGMCEGGRILHHLKHNAWREECHVIIVGYQATGTRGRQLVDGKAYIRLYQETVRVRARIHTVGGLSAHGDQNDLARWYGSFTPPPPVYLVHGEPEAAEGLAERLVKDGAPNAVVAERGMRLDLRSYRGMKMQDYEKLGAFYLGRRWDPATGQAQDDLVLYDSPDLNTHAVIIGMTGSGKTGLGISLLEEAAIDKVPVIAIDPKGDLGNLLLTFPELRPADFEPWVDPQAAATAGQTVADYAAGQAATWRKGLADWGQQPERIARLRAAADFAIYTPGSSSGRPLSVLSSFAAPPEALRDDADLYREHVQSMVTGLLTLAGIEADPVASREHILMSLVLDSQWRQGRSLDLAGLIGAIQNPGIDKIGVIDLETFYPSKERFALAMRLNNLLAAPGFKAWTEGEPLDAGALLFTADGRPRVSVLSIAHLGDAERMFFVTLLLNEIVAWMRTQSGTSSLRAILYMDEVFGFLPPVAAPPSKVLLLTLLKQARAFGLGVVLSTQNPVDLDYKALSNAGTWFIGRLQTEQDRNRVRDGLLSAAPTGGFDPKSLDATLASLGKRTFLLHNVHEKGPVLLQTRWAMSYLRGPLTRDDVRKLTVQSAVASTPAAAVAATHAPAALAATSPASSNRPLLPPDVPQLFGTPTLNPADGERLVYQPFLLGTARVAYASAKYGVDLQRDLAYAVDTGSGLDGSDWRNAEPLTLDAASLAKEPAAGAGFAPLADGAGNPKTIKSAEKEFRTWLRTEQPLQLWRSTSFNKLYSAPGEAEGEFRARLQQHAREIRDEDIAKLRDKYAAKVTTLEERLRRAEQAVDREQQQATGSKIDVVVSVGTAVLGALFGRKTISATSVGRAATAVRKAGNASRQSGDVQRAADTVEQRKTEIAALDEELAAEIETLENSFDAQQEKLDELSIRPKASDITLQFCGIGWLPFIEDSRGNLRPA